MTIKVTRRLTLASPIIRIFQESVPNPKEPGQQVYTATIRAVDFIANDPKRKWQTDPNARDANKKDNKAWQAMHNTAINDPESFLLNNNGIDLIVSSCFVENWGRAEQSATIKLEIEEYDETERRDIPAADRGFNVGGIINGGHTYDVLQSLYDEDLLDNDVVVRLTIFVNLDEEIRSAVAQARNTSKEVPEYQLNFMSGGYDKLEKDIFNTAIRKNVLFKGGENDATYTVVELLQRINLFDVKKYPFLDQTGKVNDSLPVNESYIQSKSLARRIAKNKEQEICYLYSLVTDFLWLEDKIRQTYDDLVWKFGHSGKLIPESNNKKIFQEPKLKAAFTGFTQPRNSFSTMTGNKFTFKTPIGYVFPIMAAFRHLIIETSSGAKWAGPQGITIKEIWNEVQGAELVNSLLELIREFNEMVSYSVNMTAVGRMRTHWEKCDSYIVNNTFYREYIINKKTRLLEY